jgi:3-hydroxyacyl-CoA dehydrogenase
LNEVWRLVADGILNVEDIGNVMSEGLGMRYAFLGPLETAHLNAEGISKKITLSLNHCIHNNLDPPSPCCAVCTWDGEGVISPYPLYKWRFHYYFLCTDEQ